VRSRAAQVEPAEVRAAAIVGTQPEDRDDGRDAHRLWLSCGQTSKWEQRVSGPWVARRHGVDDWRRRDVTVDDGVIAAQFEEHRMRG
jgi:hypothetical protein